jgi:hypothetical protein
MLERNERIGDLRDAVVEAARKWWDDDDRSPKYAQFLGLALEALERAEGE